MKVLVTGANGFLGSALVRHLLNAGYSVKAMVREKSNIFALKGLDLEQVEGDILDPNAVTKALGGCKIVFHLASSYRFYPWWEKKAEDIYRVNVEGVKNLLAEALKQKVHRFIFTSSIASIGRSPEGSLSTEETELNFWNKASHYARSKVLAEREVMKFCGQGLDCVILNPAMLIGERDYKPTPSGEMIIKFLNRTYPCYFEASMVLADVDDVAKAHITAIKKAKAGQRYILCNEQQYTLGEIFKLLEETSGVGAPKIKIPYGLLLGFVYLEEALSYLILKKKPFMSTEAVKFCRMSIKFDNSKAVNELDYVMTPIKESFKKAVDWYKENGYAANA